MTDQPEIKVEVPPIRRIMEVYDMLAPWSLPRARWVASSALLEAMAEEYGTQVAMVPGDATLMIMGVPVRVDESASGLLLEWR